MSAWILSKYPRQNQKNEYLYIIFDINQVTTFERWIYLMSKILIIWNMKIQNIIRLQSSLKWTRKSSVAQVALHGVWDTYDYVDVTCDVVWCVMACLDWVWSPQKLGIACSVLIQTFTDSLTTSWRYPYHKNRLSEN